MSSISCLASVAKSLNCIIVLNSSPNLINLVSGFTQPSSGNSPLCFFSRQVAKSAPALSLCKCSQLSQQPQLSPTQPGLVPIQAAVFKVLYYRWYRTDLLPVPKDIQLPSFSASQPQSAPATLAISRFFGALHYCSESITCALSRLKSAFYWCGPSHLPCTVRHHCSKRAL